MRQFQELALRPRRTQRFDYPETDPAAAVDRDPGGLVHHENRRVLVDHGEFLWLWGRLALRHPHRRDTDPIADFQAVIGLHAAAVDPYLAAAHHAVDVAFRHALQLTQQEVIDALGVAFFADLDRDRPRLA